MTNGREPNTLKVEKCMITVISVDFSLKVAEKRVRNAGCDGGEQRDYQRKWVGLEARTEYDECADNGQCQRRDLDRGKLLLHKHSRQQCDKDRGELI